MEKLYNNLEKIICFSLVSLLIIGSFVLSAKSAGQKDAFAQKHEELTVNQKEGHYPDPEEYDYISDIKKQSVVDLRQAKRNIFDSFKMDEKEQPRVTQKTETPVLELLDISYKPLGFQYQGRIVYPNGEIIAQLNTPHKSYLVKAGSKVDSFKVEHLDKQSIDLKDDKGKKIKIKYLQPAFSDELMAQVRENVSGIINIVHQNSSLYGYKVLDIEQDAVILSKYGQHLRLQKGMVHK